MTAIGLYSEGFNQSGAYIIAGVNVFSNDTLTIPGGTTTDSDPEIKLPNRFRRFLRYAGEGIKLHPLSWYINQVVEKELAINVLHHHPAQVFNDRLRVFSTEQALRYRGQQIGALIAFA